MLLLIRKGTQAFYLSGHNLCLKIEGAFSYDYLLRLENKN